MIRRVAYLSVHTSPLAVPGSGDAGGMNVYIHELAETMAGRGIEVDVFTRRSAPDQPSSVEVRPRYRVVHVEAGGADPIDAVDPAELIGEFTEGVVKWTSKNRASYDVVHSHYWLSGWAGLLLQEVLGVPLAISFHTLGRVKDASRRAGESAESLLRIAAETEVIARAGCVVASTPSESAELIQHYSANPERLCVSPPGVDHERFRPGSRTEARAKLGLEPGRLILYVGRLQPLKGPDVALDAFLVLASSFRDARLLVVGGPSGPDGEETRRRLRSRAERNEHAGRVSFLPAQPHNLLPDLYRAADVVVVPSRSESFGLVAVEAQACGIPVVAARVGGLAHVVADGESGILVTGWEPGDYADALTRLLEAPELAARLSRGAIETAQQFSWTATADRLLELYRGIMSE